MCRSVYRFRAKAVPAQEFFLAVAPGKGKPVLGVAKAHIKSGEQICRLLR